MPAFCSLLLLSYYSNNFAQLLVVKLYLVAAASCDCWMCCSVSFLLCCHSGEKRNPCTGVWEGHLVWGIHSALNPSLTGSPTLSPSLTGSTTLSPSLTGSVLRYCMRTWHSTDLFKIVLSMLLWVSSFGNSTVWTFCEGCPKKSWKALLVNCVPHLPTIHLVLATVWSNTYFCAHCN